MGGSGRQILTALTTAAASGNVMGGGAQFIQGAAVNYLQGLGAEQVKTIADNLGSETARTALQGLLACGGAAAQGASCGTAASGAAASVVLNNLFNQVNGGNQNLTSEQRQAQENLIASLITGITATAGGDAAIANAAAQIETENNSLKPISIVPTPDMGLEAEKMLEDMESMEGKTDPALEEEIALKEGLQKLDQSEEMALAAGAGGVAKGVEEAGSAVDTSSGENFSRAITSSDLGIEGTVNQLRGIFSMEDGVATARIDMIEGEIQNPLQIVNNLAETAKASGATTLRIEGTLANYRLYNVLQQRYGLISQGANDVITIPLNK